MCLALRRGYVAQAFQPAVSPTFSRQRSRRSRAPIPRSASRQECLRNGRLESLRYDGPAAKRVRGPTARAGSPCHPFQLRFSERTAPYGPSEMLPLSLVPRKKPEPRFWFCNTTPLKETAFLAPGGVTAPLNKPDDFVMLNFNLFVP